MPANTVTSRLQCKLRVRGRLRLRSGELSQLWVNRDIFALCKPCLLWVISGHSRYNRPCPLCPQAENNCVSLLRSKSKKSRATRRGVKDFC
jgi:hypothetical protein